MIFGNAKWLQIGNDGFVEIALRIERAPSKCVDADVSVEIWGLSGGRIGEAVRLVNNEPNVFVAGHDLECFAESHMNSFHERRLLLWGVLPSYFD